MVGGFYRFFDMGTTTMNCLGDMSATVIIDRLEKREPKDWVRQLTVKGKEEKKMINGGWLEESSPPLLCMAPLIAKPNP